MLNIREETSYKPSIAILRTLEGLETQGKREDFVLDMATYGRFDSGLCYGCAATACVQEIANVQLTENTIKFAKVRAQALNFDLHDFLDFQQAIDEVRNGQFRDLGKFYDCSLVEEGKELREILAAKGFTEEDSCELPAVKETLMAAYQILCNSGK